MSLSRFCIEQRQKEKDTLKKLIGYCLAGSAVFHVGLLVSLALLPEKAAVSEEPMELIVLD
ncbi:MAG: energy transducer TonB, partial [Kamptonema sp. SIO4C4]|nr:energy transducer TonB [Kamptonema sp. SIO4C4]